jgi:small multidrug resistance pump
MQLGVAYGIWGAVGVAATALFGALLHHERIGRLAALGIVLCAVGVFVIQSDARRSGRVAIGRGTDREGA